MEIHFRCRKCGKKYTAKPHQVGEKGRCIDCGEKVVVPQIDESGEFMPDSRMLWFMKNKKKFVSAFLVLIILSLYFVFSKEL